MNEWKEENGNTVTVYSRYHFAVPVRGIIKETNHNSFKVVFFTNNPGGHNVNKHDNNWFLKGQCKVDENTAEDPEPKTPTHEEIVKANLWWDFTDKSRGWLKILYYIDGLYYFPDPTDMDYVAFTKKDFIGRESADIPPE